MHRNLGDLGQPWPMTTAGAAATSRNLRSTGTFPPNGSTKAEPVSPSSLQARTRTTPGTRFVGSSSAKRSNEFEPCHRSCARGKAVLFQTAALQDGNVEIRQRIVILAIEAQMLPVAKPAAGEKHGHVSVVVARCVAQIAGQQHRSMVEQIPAVVVGLR